MIRATIHTENLFANVTRRVEELAAECVTEAAEEAKRVALELGADRRLTDIEIVPAHTTGEGYASGVVGRWYYRYQSFGTLGNAIRPKRPGHVRSHAPGTGIKPNLMWQKARLAGRRAMNAHAARGL